MSFHDILIYWDAPVDLDFFFLLNNYIIYFGKILFKISARNDVQIALICWTL